MSDRAARAAEAEFLVATAVVSMSTGSASDALITLDRVVHEFPDAIEAIAVALSYKAEFAMGQGRLDEALDACRELANRYTDVAGPRVTRCVANALSNQGVIEIRQGRATDAIATFDEFRRRFELSTDAYVVQRLAAVLYNEGIALRDLGRLGDAVPVFTDAVERFAGADPPSQRYAAMSLYNRAIVHARLLDTDGCIRSTAEMWRRFGDSGDPAIVERLAKVLYHRGVMLGRLGSYELAVADFAFLVRRFAHNQQPVIRSIVGGARRRGLLLALTQPSAHAVHNVMVQSDVRELEQDMRAAVPEARASIERRLAEYREMVDDEARTGGAWHERAVAVLLRYLVEGEPFGLFLRSFGLETEVRVGADVLGTPVRMAMLRFGEDAREAGEVERQVAAAFQHAMPFLAVGHNVPIALSQYEHRLPKLEVPDDMWQQVLVELVGAAEVIVVHVEVLSPGVVEELRMIRRLDREMRTIVVLSTPSDSTVAMSGAAQHGYGAPPAGAVAAPDHEEIAPFPWVIQAAELAAQPLEEWPLTRALLARVDAIRSQDPGMRARWDGVVF